MFSARAYDRAAFARAAAGVPGADAAAIVWQAAALERDTVALAAGARAVCVFVNDRLDGEVLAGLAALGVDLVLLRCAGYNNVDLPAAARLGIRVAHVPAYAPEAVAEHTLALLMTLNRRTHRAFNRVREGNFALDGLLGTTLHGRTVGIVGLGRIGLATARIFAGMGCRVIGHDPYPAPAFARHGEQVALDELIATSDVVSLHCPLVPATHHLIDAAALARMKPGATLINTSRGGLIDTPAVIEALKERRLGALAIDVYEQESALFFEDRSHDFVADDVFARLTTFPNVLVTGHQGFFTEEALHEIATTTLRNLVELAAGEPCRNEIAPAA